MISCPNATDTKKNITFTLTWENITIFIVIELKIVSEDLFTINFRELVYLLEWLALLVAY